MLLSYAADGAEHFPAAALRPLSQLRALLDAVPRGRAGSRLTGIPALRPHLDASGEIGRVAAAALNADCMPVRALLFDKTPEVNWSLGWHQDRTICVRKRVEVAGFGPWTMKAGLQHVVPPFALLSGMVTLRVHLDDVPADNGPLLIAPGSHRCGRVPESELDDRVKSLGTYGCLAEAGDIWLYATPILHASDRSRIEARRRVLQVDYAAEALPGGLEWLGV